MTLRSVLSWELIAALSVPLGIAGSAAAADPVAPSTGSLHVSHEPVGCMIADRSPQIEATVAPSSSAVSVRVYFRSALSPEIYYIAAERQGDRYVASLPRPQLNAGPITFSVEAASRDGVLARTAESIVGVVPNEGACPAGLRPAPIGSTTTQLTIFSESGATAPAAGFSGISRVLAGAAVAAAGVAGTVAGAVGGVAAAGGILGMSTAVAVATAAVAVGVGTAVVAQGSPNDNGRFPPGRPCTLDPRPGCQPASPSR
jgi:hypothetical protein